MLFLNISSDYVHLLDDQDERFLERNGIENTLWPTLLDYTQSHPVETIFLLNGPGGFTNLRVGTLTLNMMNTLLEHDTWTFIPLASITKINLYGYAYTQGRLPRYGIIYIGQKHNVWICDFQEKTHKQITLEEIEYSDDTFLDFVHDTYRPTTEAMIAFSMRNNTLYLHYNNESYPIDINHLRIPLTMTAQPEYLKEPTMN
jgi:tRNA A37 threonylcarbamoyladenosine modification protein TsaB